MALTPEEIARGRSLLNAALPRVAPTPKAVDIEAPAEKTYRFADAVRRIVDAAPPLTSAQRELIASLLRPSAGQRGSTLLALAVVTLLGALVVAACLYYSPDPTPLLDQVDTTGQWIGGSP